MAIVYEQSDSDDNNYETLSDTSDKELRIIEDERVKKLLETRKPHPPIIPFYDSDTSDEDEDTLGNIPRSWYDEYDHIGYDRNGLKIAKGAVKDEIDQFLENKNFVYDKSMNEVRLTKEELELLTRIQQHQYPNGFNPHEEQVEYFSGKSEIMPLSGAHEPKRRFIPSKSEGRMIMKIAAKIRANRMKPVKEQLDKPSHYDIWSQEADDAKARNRIQAPKTALPGIQFLIFRAFGVL